jgi:ADP-ribose pyrophosphatase YjhB (NUDIX family)
MAWDRIRPIALALIRRDDEILVGRHETGEDVFYRPLGGGIEVGEYAQDAVAREIREELGLEIEPIRRRAVLENVFTYRGEQAHEIVFVVESAFVDDAAYRRESFVAEEGSAGDSDERRAETQAVQPATWVAVDHFTGDAAPLYPAGLLDVLREDGEDS